MTEPAAVRPPRVSRGFRRLAIAAFLILVPVALHSLWDYLEIRRLVREIEAIRAKGEPVTEHQITASPGRLSPEQDLAGRYFMAAAHIGYPVAASDRQTLGRLYQHVLGYQPRDFALDPTGERLRALADKGHTALALADRAAALPFAQFSAGLSYSYLTSELLELLRLQSARTAALSLAGQGDAAVASAIASLKSRPVIQRTSEWSRRPDYDAAVVMSYANASGQALARYQEAFAPYDTADVTTRAVMHDRALFIERVFREFYGGDATAPRRYGTAFYGRRGGGFMRAVWRPWLTRRFVGTLRGWTELVEASRLPWPEKARRMNEVYSRFSRPVRPRLPFSSEQLAPQRSWWSVDPDAVFASTVMIPQTFTTLTLDRASVTALAVQRFRLDQGRMPATVEELRGRYLNELPVDPYSGQPFRLKAEERSFTVYSVGPDGADNGGDLVSAMRERDERGWGLAQLRGRDVGIRVLINEQEGR